MFAYVVGYGSCEDSGSVVLMHEKEFTEAQFDDMVIDCAVKIVEEDKAKGEFHHGFDDLYDKVAIRLIQDYGFQKLEYKAVFSAFGWASMFSLDDWGNHRDEQLNKLTKALIARGFSFEKDDRVERVNERKRRGDGD